MIFRDFIFYILLVKTLEACIPTQNVQYASASSPAEKAAQKAAAEKAAEVAAEKAAEVAAEKAAEVAAEQAAEVAAEEAAALALAVTTTVAAITTTDTITTTTTYPITTAYPCSVCSPIYNGACQGYQMPSPSSYCLTADEVPVSYTATTVDSYGVLTTTCSTSLACPSGTVARVDVVGSGYVMGNSDGSPTYTYCSESDGMWYSDVDSYTYNVMDIACQYP